MSFYEFKPNLYKLSIHNLGLVPKSLHGCNFSFLLQIYTLKQEMGM